MKQCHLSKTKPHHSDVGAQNVIFLFFISHLEVVSIEMTSKSFLIHISFSLKMWIQTVCGFPRKMLQEMLTCVNIMDTWILFHMKNCEKVQSTHPIYSIYFQ